MKIRSIKTNYFFNLLRIVSTTLIGVFTMPYINHTLGPENIGKVEYINSIINYFILFSALGIPIYGIRQISKVRDNLTELSKNVLEILIILIVCSFFAYIVLFSVFLNLESFSNYRQLIIIMSSMILLNNLGAEWFFQGIEDQLYITIRHIIVRGITVFLLFYFVKNTDDYIWYAIIIILNFCGSNLLNLIKLKKYINFNDWRGLNFKRHLRPALTIFIASISVSIYLQIDNFLLGYLAGDKYVGFYSVANKLLRYVITFIVTIGSVLLPRLSNLWVTNKENYYRYLHTSFCFLLLISLPSCIFFYFFAEAVIFFMAGIQFQDTVLTLKILSPTCVLVSLAYFFGYLVLYTQGKEKLYTLSVAISAMFSIVINYILIQKLNQNGAAITQVISELLGVLLLMYFIKKNKIKLNNLFNINLIKVFIANCILLVFLFLFLIIFRFSIIESFFLTIMYMIGGLVLYMLSLIILKEENIGNALKFIRSWAKKSLTQLGI